MVHHPRLFAPSVLAIMAVVLAVLAGVPAARAAEGPCPVAARRTTLSAASRPRTSGCEVVTSNPKSITSP